MREEGGREELVGLGVIGEKGRGKIE